MKEFVFIVLTLIYFCECKNDEYVNWLTAELKELDNFQPASKLPNLNDNKDNSQNLETYYKKVYQHPWINPDEVKNDVIRKQTRNGNPSSSNRWSTRVIPYTFKNLNANQISKIEQVVQDFQRKTCLKFRRKLPADKDYVEFTTGNGCSSFLGRVGGKQAVTLANNCFYAIGVIYHEILHALGFDHEHNRHDRDAFVRINYNNVIDQYKYAFNRKNWIDFGVPYDYGSVLHYSLLAFSKDSRSPTITPLKNIPPGVVIGQRNGPSRSDLIKLKKMYNCPL